MEKIGQGGMGQVFKARDTKLDRTVALKFLSSTTVDDVGKKRFFREAQAAASLNHPNIAYVFDLEQDEAQSFISMEFVDGQTVHDVLQSTGRPFPIKKAIDIAMQIAGGLHAAHERGIIHRDIKSANIMILPNGRIKIMDFGLAKLMDDTLVTQIGTRMGTVAYMSPEQAEGEEVDYRSDLWSLGVMLYEMLAGQLPFKGDAEQAVIYSILKEEPQPLTGVRTGVPMELERIVLKLLEKNPGERYQHADELVADLTVLLNRYDEFAVGYVRGRDFRKKTLTRANVLTVVAALIVISVLSLWRPWHSPSKPDKQVLRFPISMPEGRQLWSRTYYPSLAISPDGQRIVFPVLKNNQAELYVRNLNENESVPLGTDIPAGMPFFSPDGRSIGFNTFDTLKTVSLSGGVTKILHVAGDVRFGMAHWYDDHSLLLENVDLLKLDTQGGEPEVVFKAPHDPNVPEIKINCPQMLPGNKAVLATFMSEMEAEGDVVVLHLSSGKIDTLVQGPRFARYAPTGHLLVAQAGDVYAQPFDVKSYRLSGKRVRVIENVSMFKSSAQFDFSDNGTLVYAEGGDLGYLESQRRLLTIDRQGNAQRMLLPPGDYNDPEVSPDGRYLAYWRDGQNFVYDFISGRERVVTNHEPVGYLGTWTPDSKSLIINSYRDQGTFSELYRVPIDSSGVYFRLTWSDSMMRGPYGVTPDGNSLIYLQMPYADVETIQLMFLPLTGQSKLQPYPIVPKKAITPALSPDGQWLAYVAEEYERSQMLNKRQVCVRSLFGSDRVYKIGELGCGEPEWSRDGKELFFIQQRNYTENVKLMAVSIETEPEFKAGEPRLLFERKPKMAGWWWTNYCAAPDGERFIWIDENIQPQAEKMHVVYNWFEELTAKVEAAQQSQLQTNVVP